jgi:uncharacterized membrane protein
MSELVCIAFKDCDTADHVLNELRAMETEYVLDLEDAVIVVRDKDSKVHVKQCVDLFGASTTHGVALGVLWGALIGLLFMNPIAGLLGGIAGGAGGGAIAVASNEYGILSDYGINDNFIKALGSTISPGTSAIFLLIRSAYEDKVFHRISKYGGTILKTSLSNEDEERLRTALASRKHEQTYQQGAD